MLANFGRQKKSTVNSVIMHEALLKEVTFRPYSFLLVNTVNLCDQLEPAVKSAWRNLSTSCEIPDC